MKKSFCSHSLLAQNTKCHFEFTQIVANRVFWRNFTRLGPIITIIAMLHEHLEVGRGVRSILNIKPTSYWIWNNETSRNTWQKDTDNIRFPATIDISHYNIAIHRFYHGWCRLLERSYFGTYCLFWAHFFDQTSFLIRTDVVKKGRALGGKQFTYLLCQAEKKKKTYLPCQLQIWLLPARHPAVVESDPRSDSLPI